MTDRTAFIQGLRELADFLTVNPNMPVRDTVEIQVCAAGATDDERRAFVDRAALAMGVEAFDPHNEGQHWQAGLRFGPIHLFALAIDDAHMRDYREATRLGEEALAAKKAAEADVIDDIDAAADAAARTHMMPFTQSGRDTGHALCGAADGGVTHDDNEVTCISCLEGAEEQYDDARGALPVAPDDAPLMGGARR